MFLAVAIVTPAAASPPEPKSSATPPLFHGNWCGRGDANRAAPIDAFDAACKAHDLCYEAAGRGACNCDRAFLVATAALVKSRRIPEAVRSKAATANSLFSALPCESQPAQQRARLKPSGSLPVQRVSQKR
jgi:hypothetical protein